MTLEFVVVVPGLLLVLSLVIFGGRLALAHQAVEAAAAEAARTASIARQASTAAGDARAAAQNTLDEERLRCSSTTTSVDTSGFAAPVGTAATVSATVTCVVNLSDLALPGLPGSRTVTATGDSPLDTYRER
ncbi:pilus assembly protein [Kineosporia sp. J2-2]|uniref:Pilus assembly protein n=2 Tax=Kineosporia corallincola TaxID=2835133 RepID=A0ABS5TQ74_9ACTN|nr:pilus assembly protein [Kineosporia corallincola]